MFNEQEFLADIINNDWENNITDTNAKYNIFIWDLIIQYRCFKNFDNILFRSELREALSKSIDCESFTTLYTQAFNRHAPIKKKTLRANQVPYMTKTLRKAIMRRSNLENKFLKNVTPENNAAYIKQRNLCSKLYKKERRKYYSNLDPSNFTDNKMF